jgi:uncharacterized protein with WD repeat
MSIDTNVLVVRSKTNISSYSVLNQNTNEFSLFPNLSTITHGHAALPLTFDSQGKVFASFLSNPTVLTLQSAVTGDVISEISITDLLAVEFSPLGNYILTYSRYIKGVEGNLKIFRVLDGTLVYQYTLKVYKKDSFQWNANESICLRLVTNELHVLNSVDPSEGIVSKLQSKGISQFKLSPLSTSTSAVVVVTFTPEFGGKPARASIHTLHKFGDAEFSAALNSRTMFSASEASLLWNSKGMVVVTLTY